MDSWDPSYLALAVGVLLLMFVFGLKAARARRGLQLGAWVKMFVFGALLTEAYIAVLALRQSSLGYWINVPLMQQGKQVAVLPNGLARLVNMPKQFNLDVRVSSGGATAPIFRQCNKPQTTLLLVAKNWDKLGEGADWLWVKSGKFAGQ